MAENDKNETHSKMAENDKNDTHLKKWLKMTKMRCLHKNG